MINLGPMFQCFRPTSLKSKTADKIESQAHARAQHWPIATKSWSQSWKKKKNKSRNLEQNPRMNWIYSANQRETNQENSTTSKSGLCVCVCIIPDCLLAFVQVLYAWGAAVQSPIISHKCFSSGHFVANKTFRLCLLFTFSIHSYLFASLFSAFECIEHLIVTRAGFFSTMFAISYFVYCLHFFVHWQKLNMKIEYVHSFWDIFVRFSNIYYVFHRFSCLTGCFGRNASYLWLASTSIVVVLCICLLFRFFFIGNIYLVLISFDRSCFTSRFSFSLFQFFLILLHMHVLRLYITYK